MTKREQTEVGGEEAPKRQKGAREHQKKAAHRHTQKEGRGALHKQGTWCTPPETGQPIPTKENKGWLAWRSAWKQGAFEINCRPIFVWIDALRMLLVGCATRNCSCCLIACAHSDCQVLPVCDGCGDSSPFLGLLPQGCKPQQTNDLSVSFET